MPSKHFSMSTLKFFFMFAFLWRISFLTHLLSLFQSSTHILQITIFHILLHSYSIQYLYHTDQGDTAAGPNQFCFVFVVCKSTHFAHYAQMFCRKESTKQYFEDMKFFFEHTKKKLYT